MSEVYFTAVLALECSDAEAARQLLAALPLVQASLTPFDVIPLVPYDGVARLFT